jgi:competence protein ComGC
VIAKSNNKGFTLLELLAVFAILIIILTFVVPKVLATINNSKTEIDKTNLEALNRATGQYEYFLNLENDNLPQEMTQQILLDAGYINEVVEPYQVEKEFSWDIDLKEWILTEIIVIEDPGDSSDDGFDLSDDQGENPEKWYSFEGVDIETNEDYADRLIITGDWIKISGDDENPVIGLPTDNESTEGTFSINHGLIDSYTITTESEILDKTTIQDLIFGVYFESNLQDEKPASGYQFKVSYSNNDKDTYFSLEEITGIDTATPIAGKQTTLKDTVYEKLLIKIDVIQDDGFYIYVYNENSVVYSTSYKPTGFEIDATKFSGVSIKRKQQHTNTFLLDINISPYE